MNDQVQVFDRCCQIAERIRYPELLNLLQQSKLFCFPTDQVDALLYKDEKRLHDIDTFDYPFFLPFSCVTVADSAGCVILQDTELHQTGVNTRRTGIVCSALTTQEEDKTPGEGMKQGFNRDDSIMYLAQFELEEEGMAEGDFNLRNLVAYMPSLRKHLPLTEERAAVDSTIADHRICVYLQARHAITRALHEIWHFNSPHRFIVERQRQKRCKYKKGKVARSWNRSKYTLMVPADIRRYFKTPEPEATGQSKAPHPRRRHFRTYRSDRYTNVQGKRVEIAATWVGPSEATVEGCKCKVRLDL